MPPQELSARPILEQKGAAGRRWMKRHQSLDDRLEQRIELGLFAELQRQLVEQGQCRRPIRIDRLPGPKTGAAASIISAMSRRVSWVSPGSVSSEAQLGSGEIPVSEYRPLCSVADPGSAGRVPARTLPTPLMAAINFRTIGAAEVFDPVMALRQPKSAREDVRRAIRRQIDIDLHAMTRPADDHRLGRLVEDLLVAPVAVVYPMSPTPA